MATTMAFVPLVILLFFLVTTFWRIFEKAGQEGWKSMVPFYNLFIMADVARVDRKFAWYYIAIWGVSMTITFSTLLQFELGIPAFVTNLLPFFFNILFAVLFFIIAKGLAYNFGKSPGFAWGILFLSFIFLPILAFGSAKYVSEDVFVGEDILDAEF